MTLPRVTVLGAGAWGTALACAAAARARTVLWARDPLQAAALQRHRCNDRYLPGFRLPQGLEVTDDHARACAHSAPGPAGSDTAGLALTILAAPMSGLRQQLQQLPDDRPVIWLCKGFEADRGALAHELAREVRGDAGGGVLSGPSFAQEVAAGQPTALVAASLDRSLLDAAVEVFHSAALRVYTTDDIVGVEVGGAVKNVLAIAAGIVDGLPSAGLNARAAVITRGLAEMSRLGQALGARAQTFMGLSGLGDLVLTATGELSRNRRVGLLLAQGQPLAEALASLGHVAEGVRSARVVLDRATRLGVEMPITAAVVEVLEGRLAPPDALARLMARQARPEAFDSAAPPQGTSRGPA